MRHHGFAAATIALLLTFTFVSEALAEGTLSRVRSFFKGRTRTTVTGTVDRDIDATILKADDGKVWKLDGRQADRLLEAHRGAAVSVEGYAQGERFEVRRFKPVEGAVAKPAAKAPAYDDDEDIEKVPSYDDDDEDIAPAPVRRRPGATTAKKPSARDYDDDDDYASGDSRTYTVEKGDTLAGISKKFYGTTKHWGSIQKHNNIKDVKMIKPGMVLEIPAR